MKRREFLMMAIGAAVLVPASRQIIAAEEKSRRIDGIINAQIDLAIIYMNATTEEKKNIIEEINQSARKCQNTKAAGFFEDVEKELLSLNVFPAEEVLNIY